MARQKRPKKEKKPVRPEPIPPGATRQASDHDLRPWEEPSSMSGDEAAAGTPGGGTEVGGLAGSNFGDGTPQGEELNRAMGRGDNEPEAEGEQPPFSGIHGGAVGGTPAEGRAAGGHMDHGIAPGGSHPGDSTIGADPDRA
jgi:hypothetical protein